MEQVQQVPPPEVRHAEELAQLAEEKGPRPPGWLLTPQAVVAFVCGNDRLKISRKFVGDVSLVERCVITLAGERALLLVGEPGTAKSMLSELLSAAICGTSGLTVQGSAGTTEDQLRYGWNYAQLLARGPSEDALVDSPVLAAMRTGRVARVEEITRCLPEVQDALVSVLSERRLAVPELGEYAVHAAPGFCVIATANLRDRGVSEMSAALKRRFNFETVRPIADRAFEAELIARALDAELGEQRVPMSPQVLDVLVTAFADLRTGTTQAGTPVKRPETVMSTAEAVNVGVAASLSARYIGDGTVSASDIARQMVGVALKGEDEDATRIRFYLDSVVRERAESSAEWRDFLVASQGLWE